MNIVLDIKKLELNKSYEFDVFVENDGNSFFAKLTLSPDLVKLKVMGEISAGRDFTHGWSDIDSLFCEGDYNCFLLKDLHFKSGNDNFIPNVSNDIVFFETIFEVGYVICLPPASNHDVSFLGFSFCSEVVEKWIGHTIKQDEIIASYHAKDNTWRQNGKLTEFEEEVYGLGRFFAKYNLSIYDSSPEFSAGVKFPPALHFVLNTPINSSDVYKLYHNLYYLISFFNGAEFTPNMIELLIDSSSINKNALMYFPTRHKINFCRSKTVLFPLGRNIRFNDLDLPYLPEGVFNTYFSLGDDFIGYFRMFFRYQRLASAEEKFLGFFRILESLCYKSKSFLDERELRKIISKASPYLIKRFSDAKNVRSFLRLIERSNKKKYNTEKCIQDFFMRVPEKLSSNWKYQIEDIKNICKLRNDITHANNVHISEVEIEAKAKLLEVLIFLALFERVGIDMVNTSKIIHRLDGYNLIIN